MRGYFQFGTFLSFDEVAFSSPTDDGKKFAATLAQRDDFLIYESWKSPWTTDNHNETQRMKDTEIYQMLYF